MAICGADLPDYQIMGFVCVQAEGHPGDHIPPSAHCAWPQTWLDLRIRTPSKTRIRRFQCGFPATLKIGPNLYCNYHRDLGEIIHNVGVTPEGRARLR